MLRLKQKIGISFLAVVICVYSYVVVISIWHIFGGMK